MKKDTVLHSLIMITLLLLSVGCNNRGAKEILPYSIAQTNNRDSV